MQYKYYLSHIFFLCFFFSWATGELLSDSDSLLIKIKRNNNKLHFKNSTFSKCICKTDFPKMLIRIILFPSFSPFSYAFFLLTGLFLWSIENRKILLFFLFCKFSFLTLLILKFPNEVCEVYIQNYNPD